MAAALAPALTPALAAAVAVASVVPAVVPAAQCLPVRQQFGAFAVEFSDVHRSFLPVGRPGWGVSPPEHGPRAVGPTCPGRFNGREVHGPHFRLWGVRIVLERRLGPLANYF